MEKKGRRVSSYAMLIEQFSEEELAIISQMKRFFELVDGDIEFRKRVDKGQITEEDIERLRRIGIKIDIKEISVLWERKELFEDIAEPVQKGKGLTEEQLERLKDYPVVQLWFRFVSMKNKIYRDLRRKTFRVPKNPKFDAWRMRRIKAVKSELGFYGMNIDHPILAFELGDGCSVGCWFCAFAARKLKKNFDYNENKEMFRGIAEACVELFGKAQASMALLYYGTEPHDNPNYIDFLKDYAEITGYPTCTSTAIGTDPEWIRSLIAFYREGPYPWPRISVLSRRMLHKIHELFSPDELRDVELLMQMKEHTRPKVKGGRILEEEAGLRALDEPEIDENQIEKIVPQGSIACVSGFLINLVEKSIKVVSPCYTSKKWPYGYRVFDEDTFNDEKDFKEVLERLIDRSMPETPYPKMPIRFRDDLVYRPRDNGFLLVSPNQIHRFEGDMYSKLGEIIADKEPPYNELIDEMDRLGYNFINVMGAVQNMFDEGFLDEVGISRYKPAKEKTDKLSA